LNWRFLVHQISMPFEKQTLTERTHPRQRMAGESLHKPNTVSISIYNDNSGDSICVHLYPSVADKQ